MKEFSVAIKNFQIIEELVLQFKPGVTLITGANSSGKTAVFRAIDAVISNPSDGKSFIKSGKKKCSVAIKFDQGKIINWERLPKTVNYTIGEERYEKCGKQKLSDYLGDDYGFVVYNGRIMNISDEHTGLFPFYYSENELFKLFEDMFQIADSNLIFKEIEKDKQSLNNSINELTSVNENHNNKIVRIEDFLRSVEGCNLEIQKQELISQHNKVVKLNNSLVRYNQCKDLEEKTSIINSIQFISEEEIDKSFNLDKIKKIQEHVNRYKICDSVLKQVDLIPTLYDVKDIGITEDFSERLKKLITDSNKYLSIKKELQSLQTDVQSCKLRMGQIMTELAGINVCPLCGTPIEKGIL